MELEAEEFTEKSNLNDQRKSPESPIDSDKLEGSSDLTDEEMLTAESEDEQIENGLTDVGPGGDNKSTRISKVHDDIDPATVTDNYTSDITNGGEGSKKCGRDSLSSSGSSTIEEDKPKTEGVLIMDCLDGPVAAKTMKVEGNLDISIPQIIVEGPDGDIKPTDQIVGLNLSEECANKPGDETGDSIAQRKQEQKDEVLKQRVQQLIDDPIYETLKKIEIDNSEPLQKAEGKDEVLKQSVRQLINDPIYKTLKKIELELSGDSEENLPDRKESEVATPLQSEKSEIPCNSKEAGEPEGGRETTLKMEVSGDSPHMDGQEKSLCVDEGDLKEQVVIEEREDDTAEKGKTEKMDVMKLESDAEEKVVEGIPEVLSETVITQTVEPQLELVLKEIDNTILESEQIVKCDDKAMTRGPELEEKHETEGECDGVKEPLESEEMEQLDATCEGKKEVMDKQEVQTIESEDVKATESEDVKATESEDVKATESEDVKATESEDVKATESEDVKATEGEDVKATESEDVKATESEDVKATESEDVKATESEDVKATESEDVKATEGEDVKATEGEDVKATEGEDVKATEGEDVKATEGEDVKATEKEETEVKIKWNEASGEADLDVVIDEVVETIQGGVSDETEKIGKDEGGERRGDGKNRKGKEKNNKDENDVYLRPRGRAFPFKLRVTGVPMSVTREDIMAYFSQCGEVLKCWRENKRRIQVIMADEEGYKKALSLRKPRLGDADILVQSMTESVAVVTGIPPDMDPDDVAQKLIALIESIGVCVCRIWIPRTEPKTEDNPNPPLQGHAFVYFPDPHTLEKVRGTLRLELGDKELGMFASRSVFEERFCVHVSPLRGELPRPLLDQAVREAFASAGRIATVNLVQINITEGLSANIVFSTQAAAQKALTLEGVEVLGKPVTTVPFRPSEHSMRDRSLWIRITNMPKDVTEKEVRKHFAIAGEPREIMMDDNGACVMIVESEAAVQKCLSLHQTYIRNDRISVLLSDLFGGRRGNNRPGFRRQGGRGRGRGGGGNGGSVPPAQSRNSSHRRGGNGNDDHGSNGGQAAASGSCDMGQGGPMPPQQQQQQTPRTNRGGGGGGFSRAAFRGGRGGGGGGGGGERGRGAFVRGNAPRFSRSRGFFRNRDKMPGTDNGGAAGQ